MPLHRRSDRGQLVNPSGAGPLPKLKVRRGADGKLEVEDPAPEPRQEETRPDEKPPYAEDPRGIVPPDHVGF